MRFSSALPLDLFDGEGCFTEARLSQLRTRKRCVSLAISFCAGVRITHQLVLSCDGFRNGDLDWSTIFTRKRYRLRCFAEELIAQPQSQAYVAHVLIEHNLDELGALLVVYVIADGDICGAFWSACSGACTAICHTEKSENNQLTYCTIS
jgi:hypothetical protein